MNMGTGGDALIAGIMAHGVDTVFGLPGAQVYGLFDAMARAGLNVVGARHEQACGYMAFGYARATGRPSVFAVVPGPGVLNASAAAVRRLLIPTVPSWPSAAMAGSCSMFRNSRPLCNMASAS